MKTIKSEFIGTDATGKDFFRVIIVSESSPDSFPTSGADVDGVPDTAGIAAGSVLLTPDGNSVLYTDGWSEDGGGGGGGDLVSVTLSPPISAAPELSSFFPISYDSLTPEEKRDGKVIRLVPVGTLNVGDEYSYTITPGADWYVNKGGGNFGEQGEPVTLTAVVEDDLDLPILELPVGVSNEPTTTAEKIVVVNIIYQELS